VPDGDLRVIVWHQAGRVVILTADHGRIVADVVLPTDRDRHEQAAGRVLRRLGIERHGDVETSDGAPLWRARRKVSQ
jgi:hypothetical protein